MQPSSTVQGVSIIVAVRNMEKTVGRCIESLLAVDYPEKEIIIVDDESTDDTPKILRRYPVHVVRIKNRGVSGARNEGLRLSTQNLVAFTDADCYVEKDWLTRLTKHFDNPQVGGVGGFVDFERRGIVATAISIEYAQRFKNRATETRSIACINAIFRTEALQALGGFRRLGGELVGGEDIDLSYRIIEAGWKLIYEAAAVVHHDGEEMSRGIVKRNFRNAVVSITIYHGHKLARQDRFFGPKLLLEPAVFAASIAALFVAFAIGWPEWPVLLAAPVFWNLPLAIRTAHALSRPLSLLVVPLVLFVRSGVFLAGAFWGLVKLASARRANF